MINPTKELKPTTDIAAMQTTGWITENSPAISGWIRQGQRPEAELNAMATAFIRYLFGHLCHITATCHLCMAMALHARGERVTCARDP